MQQIKKKIIDYILKKLNYVSYSDQPSVNYTVEHKQVNTFRVGREVDNIDSDVYMSFITKKLAHQLAEDLISKGIVSVNSSILYNGRYFVEASIKVIK